MSNELDNQQGVNYFQVLEPDFHIKIGIRRYIDKPPSVPHFSVVGVEWGYHIVVDPEKEVIRLLNDAIKLMKGRKRWGSKKQSRKK